MEFELKPEKGWEFFSRHKELTDLVFGTFVPLVNQQDWSYMNLVKNTSMFEDTYGNLLTLIYIDQERLAEIHFSKPKPGTSVSKEMSKVLTLLSDDYGLQKLHRL